MTKAIYIHHDTPQALVQIGPAITGDGRYFPVNIAPHPEAPHIAYRVLAPHGMPHNEVVDKLHAILVANPHLTFRDCMVYEQPSVENWGADFGEATRTDPSYASLRRALDAAYAQSAEGKGKARHGNGLDFDQQPIMKIGRMVGAGYPVGQAMKKGQEAIGMARRGEHDAAKAELLGAIVYAAAAYLLIDEAN